MTSTELTTPATTTPVIDYTKLPYAQVKAMSFPTTVQWSDCVRCGTHFNYDLSRAKPICNSARKCDERLALGDPNFNKRYKVEVDDEGTVVSKTRRNQHAPAVKPAAQPAPQQPAVSLIVPVAVQPAETPKLILAPERRVKAIEAAPVEPEIVEPVAETPKPAAKPRAPRKQAKVA